MTSNVKTPKTDSSISKTRKPGKKTSTYSFAGRKLKAGLGKMSDTLFEQYELILPLLDKQRRNEAASKYEIGILVADVLDNMNVYGWGSAEMLAEALGHHHTTLRRYARVTKTWQPAAFKDLLKRKGKTGLPLSFSHLIEISIADDSTEQEEWIELVLKYGVSVRELARRMKKNASAGPAVDETTTETQDDCGEDEMVGETNEADDYASDKVVDGTDKAVAAAGVRRSLARLMSIDVQSIPEQDKAWAEYVFEPLEDEPEHISGAVEEDLRETSASLAGAIKSLQAYKNRIDGLLKPVTEGGELNG